MLVNIEKVLNQYKDYLQIEKALFSYKQNIIESQKNKIDKLEFNQKPKLTNKKGVIYIIQINGDKNLYKLGKTIDIKRRLKEYNSIILRYNRFLKY